MTTTILFVSKGEDSSSTRYRALQFFPLWRAAGYDPEHVTASGGIGALLRTLRSARHADIVVVLRKTFPRPLLWLLRRAAKKLVFDFDDAIFCNTDGRPSATRMARFAAMVRCCDHVCAGNAFLAQQALRFNPAVTIIPTSIDVAKYRVAAAKPADSFDLVWIGSSSTRKYLVDAVPWLEEAAARIPSLRLKVIADFTLPPCRIPVVTVAWDAATEARELASAHIGIAPMRDDDWSRGKCALKVLQYMAAGLPVVSSNAGMNVDVIANKGVGFLASSQEDWCRFLAILDQNPDMRGDMGDAGVRAVGAGYSNAIAFAKWQSVATSVSGL